MSRIRGFGNKDTELRLIAIFRAHGITGWRRGAVIGGPCFAKATQGKRKTEGGGRKTEDGRQKAETGRRRAGGKRTARFAVRPDFVFSRLKLAVFVDGCFWHGCPKHGTKPKNNAAFWRRKIAANQARDRLVTRTLRACGWKVFRIWEHELTKKNEGRLLARLQRHLG